MGSIKFVSSYGEALEFTLPVRASALRDEGIRCNEFKRDVHEVNGLAEVEHAQAILWCKRLGLHLPTSTELHELALHLSITPQAHGWLNYASYHSSTLVSDYHYCVRLFNGVVYSFAPDSEHCLICKI
jgi:hypothetical protein